MRAIHPPPPSRGQLLIAAVLCLIFAIALCCSGCSTMSLGQSQSFAIAATTLDLASTELALRQCQGQVHEGNPALRIGRVTAWATILNVALITAFYFWSNHYPDQAKAHGWQIVGGIHLTAGASNLYQINRCTSTR